MNDHCPVCGNPQSAISDLGQMDAKQFDCPHCGVFRLPGTLIASLPTILRENDNSADKISHAIRKMERSSSIPKLTAPIVNEVLRQPLPRPKEQADLLIRWLGENLPGPGALQLVNFSSHGSVIGAKSPDGFALIVDHLFDTDLVKGDPAPSAGNAGQAFVTLTFRGWDYFEELIRGQSEYRRAFMAMKFGDEVLTRIFSDVFQPAARCAGFEIFKLDDAPRAGLIDNRLRVEIQSSDFLVADLTHDNNGAYWEAGYAEGLGKPVIYTCEATKFKERKTHFDTNHQLTIPWEAEAPAEAGALLTATIRATLPHLSRLLDEAE